MPEDRTLTVVGKEEAPPDERAGETRTRQGVRAAGKALRTAVPRTSHAGWKPHAGRRDPVDVLIESSQGRIETLVPIRYGRMMETPFRFYRGAAAIMAADLAHTPATGVRVQACGDCHLLNFGGFATPERRIIFDINDFDETLPAPWEWDVKRLAASIVIAGRNNTLKKSACRAAAANAVRGYRKRMAKLADMPMLEVWYSSLDVESLLEITEDAALKQRATETMRKGIQKSSTETLYPKMVDHGDGRPRIKDEPPLIFHSEEQNDPAWGEAMRANIAQYRASLQEDRRMLFDQYRFADIAIKAVGVGSVGTRCAVSLLLATDDDPLFLQVKEARESVLEPYAGKSEFKERGHRVVVGQRIMQAASDIFLGWTTDPRGRHYYIRQLRDVKISPTMEGVGASLLFEYAKFCGWALADAHARSGQAGVLAGYMGKSDALDEAIADFAEAYADQNEQDHAALLKAVRSGCLKAIRGK